MKRLLGALTTAVAVLAIVLTPGPTATADEGPYVYGGHEYWVRTGPCLAGWQAAEDYAVGLGGHLVAINDSAENDFVRAIIPPYGGWWIGLTDTAMEGNWVWSNGDPGSYLNWNLPYEPNGGVTENCGEILGVDGDWNDLPCDRCIGAVIEIEPPPFSDWRATDEVDGDPGCGVGAIGDPGPDWTTTAFDDSSWGLPSAPVSTGYRPPGVLPEELMWYPGAPVEVFLRYPITLTEFATSATARLWADDNWELYVNGVLVDYDRSVGAGDHPFGSEFAIRVVDITNHLVRGDNVIAVRGWDGECPAHDSGGEAIFVDLNIEAPPVAVPIRWCGVTGAPSVDNPSLVGESTVNGVLLQRQTRATDGIFLPQAGLLFQSGTTASQPSFPVLTDPDTSIGEPGDVFVDPDVGDYTEFFQLIRLCREDWVASDPSVIGITAVNIRQFVDATGAPTNLLGMGGRADPGDCSEQMISGRVMVTDGALLADPIDRILAHELGHGLSIRDGDGVDNDANDVLDDENDPVDGSNLMQYDIAGTFLTVPQVNQLRNQALACIPDFGDAAETNGRLRTDPLFDVPGTESFVDLTDIGMRRDGPGETTDVFNGVAAPVPDGGEVDFFHFVDLDDDPITGGRPGGLRQTEGIELMIETTVAAVGGLRQVTTTVWVWDGAEFVLQTDPGITARAIQSRVGLFQDLSGPLAPDDPAIAETVVVSLPNAILPPAAMTPTLYAEATNPATGTTDNGIAELDFTPPVFPRATVTPETAVPGATVTVNATGLPMHSPVEVYLGTDLVATGSTDGEGNASVPFTVPTGATGGERLVTIGVFTASETVTAVTTLGVPTAPFFITPPTPEQGTLYDLLPGTDVWITVRASHLDPGETVTLGVVDPPSGAWFFTEPGNPATADFWWFPSPEQSGIHGVTFTATDGTGNVAPPRSISIAAGLTVEASIDIKPKRYPNYVQPTGHREMPVTLFGRQDFDIHEVDIATLRFGPLQVAPIHVNPPRDSNNDGYDDKIMLFIPADTGIVCGDTGATLTGEFFDGREFAGTDSIVTVGCSFSSDTGEKVATTAEPDVFGDND